MRRRYESPLAGLLVAALQHLPAPKGETFLPTKSSSADFNGAAPRIRELRHDSVAARRFSSDRRGDIHSRLRHSAMPIDELASWVSDGCREWNLDDACDALYDDVFGGDVTWPQAVTGTDVKPRTVTAPTAQSETGRQIGCPPAVARCPVGMPHLQPPAAADFVHEPIGSTGSGFQWEIKHPLSWSSDDVLDWLFSVASRKEYGVDFLRYPAEAFCNATGAHLAAMTEAEFVHRMGPDYGRLLHDLFWRTLSQCGWPSLAGQHTLPLQQPPPPAATAAVRSGRDECLDEMRPQQFPLQLMAERANPMTMATVTSPTFGATATLTSEGGTDASVNSLAGRMSLYLPDPYALAFTPGRRTCSVAIQDYSECRSDETKAATFGRSSLSGEPPSRRPSWPPQKQRQQQFLQDQHDRLVKPDKSPISLLDTLKLDQLSDKQRSTDSDDSGIFSQSGSIAEPACSGDSLDDDCCDEECMEDDEFCDEDSDGDRPGSNVNSSDTSDAKRCSSRDEAGTSYSAADAARNAVHCKPDGMSAATAKSKLLWEFVRDLLKDPQYNPRCIKWEDKAEGVFRFVQSDTVAKMWGRIKNNENMTYEKLSRAMRYYYKRGILERVDGKRLVYKFSTGARGWS